MSVWETPIYWRCPRALWWVGVLGVVLYAAFRVVWPDIGKLGESITALLGLIAVLAFGREVRRSAALWLLLAAIVVQILSWTLGYFHHPQWIATNPELDRLAKLFIFIGVAWWLGGSTRNTLLAWGLGLLGYVIATFLHGEGIQEWLTGLQGDRTGFGIRNHQHGSMLFGVVFLGLAIFSIRIWAPGKYRLARVMVWCLLLLISLTGIVIGQTRAVWLALALSFPFAGLLYLIYWSRHTAGRRLFKPLAISLVSGGIVIGVVGAVFKDTLQERIGNESQVVNQLLQGNADSLPYTSIGIRIHTWIAASEWIAERPLIGWSGEGRSLVIDHTAWLPQSVKDTFGHLHNFLLEVWVAYGLLGVAVIAALAYWIGRGTWLAWRGGVLPGDMALFGAAFFVYWVVVNQFESYNSFWTGVYVHNLVLGGLVTHYWHWQIMTGKMKRQAQVPHHE